MGEEKIYDSDPGDDNDDSAAHADAHVDVPGPDNPTDDVELEDADDLEDDEDDEADAGTA